MSFRRGIRIFGLSVLGLALLLAIAWRQTRGSQDPNTNLSYISWKMGLSGFKPQFAYMIKGDEAFWEEFLGKPFEELQKQTGTPFYDGSTFPLATCRGKYWEYNSKRNPATKYMFFDADKRSFGWCVIVEDGKISGYGLARD